MKKQYRPIRFHNRVHHASKECDIASHSVRLNIGQNFNIITESVEKLYPELVGYKWEYECHSNFFRHSATEFDINGDTIFHFAQMYDLTKWADLSNVYLGTINLFAVIADPKDPNENKGVRIKLSEACVSLECKKTIKQDIVTVVEPNVNNNVKLEPQQHLCIAVSDPAEAGKPVFWQTYCLPWKRNTCSFKLCEDNRFSTADLTKLPFQCNNPDDMLFCVPRIVCDEVAIVKGYVVNGLLPLNFDARQREQHFWFSYDDIDIEQLSNKTLPNGVYEACEVVIIGKNHNGRTVRTIRTKVSLSMNSRSRKKKNDLKIKSKLVEKTKIEKTKLIKGLSDVEEFVKENVVDGKWNPAYSVDFAEATIFNPKELQSIDLQYIHDSLRIAFARPIHCDGIQDKTNITPDMKWVWSDNFTKPEGKISRAVVVPKGEVKVGDVLVQVLEIVIPANTDYLFSQNPTRKSIYIGDFFLTCIVPDREPIVFEICLFRSPPITAHSRECLSKNWPKAIKEPYGPAPANQHLNHYSHQSKPASNNRKQFDYGFAIVDFEDEYQQDDVCLGQVLCEKGLSPYMEDVQPTVSDVDKEYGYDSYDTAYEHPETFRDNDLFFSDSKKKEIHKKDNSSLQELTFEKKEEKAVLPAVSKIDKRKFLDPICNPLNKSSYDIELNEILVIRMAIPETLFKDVNYRNCLWTANEIHGTEGFRLWLNCARVQKVGELYYQEFFISIVPPMMITNQGITYAGTISFDCERETRAVNVNAKHNVGIATHEEFMKTVNVSDGKVNKISVIAPDAKELSGITEDGVYRITNPSKDGPHWIGEDCNKIELIFSDLLNKDDTWVIRGKNVEFLSNSVWKVYNGVIVQRVLIDISSSKNASNYIGSFTGTKGDKTFNVFIWKRDNANPSMPKVKEVNNPVIKVKNSRGGADLYLKSWGRVEEICIQPSDRLHIDLPDPFRILNLKYVEGKFWKIKIKQTSIPNDVWDELDEDIKSKIDKDHPWYGLGLLMPKISPWQGDTYLLPSLDEAQSNIVEILEALWKTLGERKTFEIAKLEFCCDVHPQFVLQKELTIAIKEYHPKEILAKRQSEIILRDPKDQHKQQLIVGQILTIKLPKKIKVKAGVTSENKWSLKEQPPFLTYLTDKNGSVDQDFRFEVRESDNDQQGTILFECNDLKKRLMVNVE